MRNSFKNFLQNEFPLQRLKTKTEANSSEYNLRTRAAEEINRSLSPEQVQAEKRKNNENIGESKKKKLNHEQDKKNQSSPNSALAFDLECFHCDASNKNPKEIYDHWTNTHKRKGISPFLFQIGHQKNQPSITLTNMELNRLLAINNPSKSSHSRSSGGNLDNCIKYLLCGQCETKLDENDYFKHIEKHVNGLKARKDGINPKTSSKIFHSNTKVIFSNALVLTKHNLSTTRLGDCEKFDKFISTLLNVRPKVTVNAGRDELRTEIVQPIVSSTSRGSTEQNKQMQGVNARNSTADSGKPNSFISTLLNIKSEVIDEGNIPSIFPPTTILHTANLRWRESEKQMQNVNSNTTDNRLIFDINTHLNLNIKTEKADIVDRSAPVVGNVPSETTPHREKIKKEKISPPSQQIQGENRKSSENSFDTPNQKSNQQNPSVSTPNTCDHRPSNDTDKKHQEETPGKKSISKSSFMFCCYYCDLEWSGNLNKIFDHWTINHSSSNDSPFLFHIAYEFDTSIKYFKFLALTNSQLHNVLTIKSPSKPCHSNSSDGKAENYENHIAYLICSECKMKLTETEFFQHIERHVNGLKDKSSKIDPKTRLKIIYSNTKVIFSNSLVLTKHNLSKTHLSDEEKFDKFIDMLLNNTKGEANDTSPSSPVIKTAPPSTNIWQTPSRGTTQSTNQMQRENVKSEVSGTDANSEIIIDKNTEIQWNKNIKTERADDASPSSSFSENFSPTVSHSPNQVTELQKQLRNINSMSIVGILQRDNEELHDIFSRICQRLQINIKFKRDVFKVVRLTPRVIGVRFKEITKKDEFLNSEKAVYLNEILPKFSGSQSTRILFRSYLTPFYMKIQEHLQKAHCQGRIHAFRLTKDGFKFKKSQNSRPILILSVEQFEKFINDDS